MLTETNTSEPAREGDTINVQVAGWPARDGVYVVELAAGHLVAERYDGQGFRSVVLLDGPGVSYQITERSPLTSDQKATLRKLTERASAATLAGQLRKGAAWTANGDPVAWAVLADYLDTLGMSSDFERRMSRMA